MLVRENKINNITGTNNMDRFKDLITGGAITTGFYSWFVTNVHWIAAALAAVWTAIQIYEYIHSKINEYRKAKKSSRVR